jgi:hypothetical protein
MLALSSRKKPSILKDRRTSQDCIDVRYSKKTSQALQEVVDGEILVAQLMLDRFAGNTIKLTSFHHFHFLCQWLAN